MRTLLLSLALALCAPPARAYEFDAALSAELAAEFKKTITATATGAEVYARLEKISSAQRPGILIRYDDSIWLASFIARNNTIYFNSRAILRFFGSKNQKPSRVTEILHNTPAARARFVRCADALYLHELVHALQASLYPNYRPGMPAGNPVEFEYEAYLTENLYWHEKMKKDPGLLKAFISGSYYDIYTADTLGAYLMLSLDMEGYKEKIRKKYEEEAAGYATFAGEVAAQKNTVADSKIIAYASGQVGDYSGKTAVLEQLQSEKETYAAFLKDFYEARWPAFSAEALLFVGGAALEAGNYPLALECLAVADENAGKYGVSPEEFRQLKEKGAVAVLEAEAFIKDHRKEMPLEALSRHLRALEEACGKTGRAFPDALSALRSQVYPKAARYYAGRASRERDREKKEAYRENAAYFSQARGTPRRE